jgi:hypothetical protein
MGENVSTWLQLEKLIFWKEHNEEKYRERKKERKKERETDRKKRREGEGRWRERI